MTRRLLVVLGLTLAAVSGGGVSRVRAARRAARAEAAAHALAERELRAQDIAFFAARVARDPLGAADRARLAALYLQRARETGSFEAYRRADALARQSLALRLSHNDKSAALLASALLGQHRFTEALDVARALSAREPEAPGYQALLGEVQLEVGDYDGARASFAPLWRARRDLSIAPRLARWLEVTGRTEAARRVWREGLAEARARTDLPREQVAWFWLRTGDFAQRHGSPDEAEYALRAALDLVPDDYRALGALARLEASRRRWRRAAALAEQSIAIVPEPASLGLLSDTYAALGDTAQAERYARAMEAVVRTQPGAWHRAWSLFLLDHDRRVAEVLANVRAELRTRRDVYGYDLLAWALHKQGRDREAREAMARALAQGTEDVMLFYHAAQIAAHAP